MCIRDRDHISSYEDLGDHWLKETKYYWEHYKDLKKPGTCTVNGFFGIEEAVKVIKDQYIGNINNPDEVGKVLAKKLKLQGADEILREIFEQFREK